MNYITRVLVLTCSFLLSVALVCWFIDPYGFYWSPSIDGINLRKTQAGGRVRTVSPYRAEKLKPQTILIGNSRVQIGMAAESSYLANSTAYNLAIPGAPLSREMQEASYQMQHNPDLKTIYLSLDFRYFLHKHIDDLDEYSDALLFEKMHKAPESHLSNISLFVPALLSFDSLKASITTIFKQGAISNTISPLGSNSGGFYEYVVKNEGKKSFFFTQLTKLHQKFSREDVAYFNGVSAENYNIALLRRFIKHTENHDIEVKYFINPYHFTYMQVIHESGRWKEFLTWKKDLAELNEEFPEVEIWDFSLFNEVTLESVNFTKNKQPMKWFWEPAHYRVSTGELMLKYLTENHQSESHAILLNKKNLENILENNQRGLIDSKKIWLDIKDKTGA